MTRGVKRDSPHDLEDRIAEARKNIARLKDHLAAEVDFAERAVAAEQRFIDALERQLAQLTAAQGGTAVEDPTSPHHAIRP